jgi:hypothetical protein
MRIHLRTKLVSFGLACLLLGQFATVAVAGAMDTFDAFRIEARGANLTTGDFLERTAWVAPERMRGFLAQENPVRRNGQLVESERTELIEHAPGSATGNDGRFPVAY